MDTRPNVPNGSSILAENIRPARLMAVGRVSALRVGGSSPPAVTIQTESPYLNLNFQVRVFEFFRDIICRKFFQKIIYLLHELQARDGDGGGDTRLTERREL